MGLGILRPKIRISTLCGTAFSDAWIAINIVLSAGLYLFDFVTNVLTAKEYHDLSHIRGLFLAIILIMVAAHLGNAIIFWYTLPPEDQPISQAYFLPLIQLWRLGKLLWLSCTCQGIRSLESEAKPLYNILAIALEAGPQLVLQLIVFRDYNSDSGGQLVSLSRLRLSMLASQLSAAYNGAIAIMAFANKDTIGGRLGFAVAGGTYIFAAMLLRSLSFVVVTTITLTMDYRFFLPFFAMGMLVIFFSSWFVSGENPGTMRSRLLRCAAYSYAGLSVGPLYPMLSERQLRTRNDCLGSRVKFRLQLWIACICHLVLDFMVLPVAIWHFRLDLFLDRRAADFHNVMLPDADPNFDTLQLFYMARFLYGVLLYVSSMLLFMLVDCLSETA